MGDETGIHWTDSTWLPVTGCSHVSPGCDNCYAEAHGLRLGWSRLPWTGANAGANVVLHKDHLRDPYHWKKPRHILVFSMADLFSDEVPNGFINHVWLAMFDNPRHIFQVLTKRPERLLAWTRAKAAVCFWPVEDIWPDWIWVGVSVEDRRRAGERLPLLLELPAAVRWVSAEPLLEPLDMTDWTHGLSWVVCGGESGPHARPMHEDWARNLRDQCIEAGTPFFFKQWGGRTPNARGRLLDGRTWDEMPIGYSPVAHLPVTPAPDSP